MGNNIKLPSSHKEQSESRISAEAETKNYMKLEIDRIENQVTLISNQIDQLECNLKRTRRNIEYYKIIIADMNSQLHQVQMDQINAQLTYENYAEKAKSYLETLKEIGEEAETDSASDNYPENNLHELEETISSLEDEIFTNEEMIKDKIRSLS